MSSVTIVIPARLASTRLPEKPLAVIKGKTMIQRVYDAAAKAKGVDRVIVATDHPKIEAAVKAFGGQVQMTSSDLQSGTDRVGAVARICTSGAGSKDNDIYINVQGDEPLMAPENIEASLELVRSGRFPIGTCASPLPDDAALKNPNVVKVLIGNDGSGIYFSRFPIPYTRVKASPGGPYIPWQHQGIYVYTRQALLKFCEVPRTELEVAESLEQLRALHYGMTIGVAKVSKLSIGVDTAEDLELVRSLV